MATKKCPGCGGPVSRKADNCPHCGRPSTTKQICQFGGGLCGCGCLLVAFPVLLALLLGLVGL